MSNVKERIIGAVTVMNEEDAAHIWKLITDIFQNKQWASIPVENPDDIDMKMIEEMKNDADCREFVSSDEAMKMLGL